MPVKLIGTVVLLIVVTIFCGFNIGEANRCDINLLFHTFKSVPVFFTVLISFFFGMMVMFPFTIGNARRKAALKEIEDKARKEKEDAKVQAKADAQAKKDAAHAEKEAKKQAALAEKERKEQERLSKKNAKSKAASTGQTGAIGAINPANEVPVIKTDAKPVQTPANEQK